MESSLPESISSAIESLNIEAKSLRKQMEEIAASDSFPRAIQLIDKCEGKIILTGIGKSGLCGEKIAASFSSIGIPSFFLNALDAYHGQLGVVTKHDLVIVISYSGRTEELLRLTQHIRAITPIICLCGDVHSPLASFSECVLKICIESEADPLKTLPTSSVITTLAIGDALTAALMRKRNVSLSDIYKHHPGGSIGSLISSQV